MDKLTVKKQLKGKIIAVIRCDDQELAWNICREAIENGIGAVEVTYTVKGAGELIKRLKAQYPDKIIGAGTVINVQQAKEAVESGADFVVSPCIISEVAEFISNKGVLCSMAGVTPTEVFRAYRLGVDIVKLFPGELYGPAAIKALKGPFPFIEIMPTGGVNDKNIKEWFDSGAYAVGVGGYLTKGVDFDNLDLVGERIRQLQNALK
ncbi:bifunctional 4-hydroxy-2-oxoglutarate aldolase/2-dehydro-3-deoxy-phosphogluconate aldolase [Caldanaerobius polysaccharolyticus]|uniref:bifunctional 4-hydroxy-2-oxoglutarate aldolase/2-dehydro-3-deoxy-phosphogluconate aldolase n=1 Tax=Caldanaerobius polysaccharolyticus TaxID=44256 RepID=UPI00047E7653|nr:bifunctional 4-hydroxy-2-oxoglutarate aldolase/2-dehydro-3-deoxy-phosphogluconate aldolase [Caldanaerobius polysaccharolyticus]